jgi:predicted lipoprotein with Yx(FWY)xxD motif
VAVAFGVLGLAGLASTAAATRAHGVHRIHRTRGTTKTLLTSYGGKWGRQLVVEMKGQKLSLFSFSRDSAGKSACYGKCSKTWYPLIDHGHLVVAKGSHINTRKVKTFRRKNGSRQVEYYGQPLYRCHKDTKTGELSGADSYQFKGSWGLMGAQGSPLTRPGYGGGKPIPGC